MILYGPFQGGLFLRAAEQLARQGMGPRIRLYRTSSNGLKMRALEELSVVHLLAGDYASIERYVMDTFGGGDYCAKLFSTRYGRNILEGRYDFTVARRGDVDVEDEDF